LDGSLSLFIIIPYIANTIGEISILFKDNTINNPPFNSIWLDTPVNLVNIMVDGNPISDDVLNQKFIICQNILEICGYFNSIPEDNRDIPVNNLDPSVFDVVVNMLVTIVGTRYYNPDNQTVVDMTLGEMLSYYGYDTDPMNNIGATPNELFGAYMQIVQESLKYIYNILIPTAINNLVNSLNTTNTIINKIVDNRESILHRLKCRKKEVKKIKQRMINRLTYKIELLLKKLDLIKCDIDDKCEEKIEC
jgi:hypothetical protein